MIIGVDTDMIEIERTKKACKKEAFFVYTCTEKERYQAGGNITKFTGDFDVKEAQRRMRNEISCDRKTDEGDRQGYD